MSTLVRNLLLTVLLLGGLTDAALADRPHRDRYDDRQYSEEGRHRDRNRDGDRGRGRGEDRQRERGMSLDQAVRMAQQRYKAKVVRAQARQDGDRQIYHLRLMSSDGTIRDIRIDAASGAEI